MDYPTTMVFDQNDGNDYTSERNSRTGKFSANAPAPQYYNAVSKPLNNK